uniref:Uncharacterized protein n=1 Tax=Arundo donax TaxID=35708 RepID=A0A0A9G2Q8_ARUDO
MRHCLLHVRAHSLAVNLGVINLGKGLSLCLYLHFPRRRIRLCNNATNTQIAWQFTSCIL